MKRRQPPPGREPGQAKPDRVSRLIALIKGEIPAGELAEDLAACLDAVTIMAAAYASAESGSWEPVAKLG